MPKQNKLLIAPPYPVEQMLKKFGNNLRIARIRRNLTLQEVAEKIGTTSKIIANLEKGKVSSNITVLLALLWVFDLLEQLSPVADPSKDTEGMALSLSRGRERASNPMILDNDF